MLIPMLAAVAVMSPPTPVVAQAGPTIHEIGVGGVPAAQPMADGGFLVVWSRGSDVLGRRVSSVGEPLASEFSIREDTAIYGYSPSLTRLSDDSFVVVWTTSDAYDFIANREVFGRRLDSTGMPSGGEFLVNDGPTRPADVKVRPTRSGGFVVDWTTGYYGIYTSVPWSKDVRVFDSTGTPLTGDLQVTDGTTTSSLEDSRITPSDDGGFIVAWSSDVLSPSLARRLDSSGQPTGAVISLGSIQPTSGTPAFSALDGGGYRVVWPDPTPGNRGIRFGYADQNLELVGPGVLIEGKAGTPVDAQIIVDSRDRPIVLWQERRIGHPTESFFRYLSAQDALTGATQTVGADPGVSISDSLLSLSGDRGILIWNQSGSVYGRAFSVPVFLDGFESGGVGTWSTVVP